jgi:hypothetical protein
MKTVNTAFEILICIASGLIGYQVNLECGDPTPKLWAILDFIFWPIVWIKWLIFHQIHLSTIKAAFAFLLN